MTVRVVVPVTLMALVMLLLWGSLYRLPDITLFDHQTVAEEFSDLRGGEAQRWEPAALAGTGLELALTERADGMPEVLYKGSSAGSTAFVAGWAVEVTSRPTATGTAYLGVAIADATTIRFGSGDDALRVPTTSYPGRPELRLFAVHVPVDGLIRVHANDIVALDAKDRLLGRQHYNDGKGGFGANDGLYDRNWDK